MNVGHFTTTRAARGILQIRLRNIGFGNKRKFIDPDGRIARHTFVFEALRAGGYGSVDWHSGHRNGIAFQAQDRINNRVGKHTRVGRHHVLDLGKFFGHVWNRYVNHGFAGCVNRFQVHLHNLLTLARKLLSYVFFDERNGFRLRQYTRYFEECGLHHRANAATEAHTLGNF